MFISLDIAGRTYGKENVEFVIKEKEIRVITQTFSTPIGNTNSIDYVNEEELATLLAEAGKI